MLVLGWNQWFEPRLAKMVLAAYATTKLRPACSYRVSRAFAVPMCVDSKGIYKHILMAVAWLHGIRDWFEGIQWLQAYWAHLYMVKGKGLPQPISHRGSGDLSPTVTWAQLMKGIPLLSLPKPSLISKRLLFTAGLTEFSSRPMAKPSLKLMTLWQLSTP